MTEERYNELKLAIFEKCEDGEITESEKGSLLTALNTVMESTAYNRKIQEYKREIDKLIEKKHKLEHLMNKEGVSKVLKDKISDDIKEINMRIRNIERTVKKLDGDTESLYKISSTQYGRSAARSIADGSSDGVVDYDVRNGRDTKKDLIRKTGYKKPEEKSANIYKDYADLKKK